MIEGKIKDGKEEKDGGIGAPRRVLGTTTPGLSGASSSRKDIGHTREKYGGCVAPEEREVFRVGRLRRFTRENPTTLPP